MEYKKFSKYLLIGLILFSVQACNQSGWGDSSIKLKSKTLHVGFNGLITVNKRQIFEDKLVMEKSWLKSALTLMQWQELIRQVDFEKNFILVYSFGKRSNANGKIIMNRVAYTTHPQSKFSSINISVDIGIAYNIADKKDCNSIIDIESFPFIVELVERPKNRLKLDIGGYTNYNFGDDCTSPIAGKPTPE